MSTIHQDVNTCHNDSPLELLRRLDVTDWEIEYCRGQVEISLDTTVLYLNRLDAAEARRRALMEMISAAWVTPVAVLP
jgi:hypothetical protein